MLSLAEKQPAINHDFSLAEAEFARRSLMAFTKYTYPGYRENWHHSIIASKMDAFMRHEIKNLMVFVGPQTGKSELSSRRLPAKMLGDNPDLKVGIIAYNHTIASKFNRDTQRIITSPEYREIYPGTRLNHQNIRTQDTWLRNADEFEIVDRRGSLVSVGVGGGLTSRKLDMAIIDDIYKDALDAWSQTIRERVKEWYLSVLKTRLHNESQQLIVFTRWHEEDLGGYLLATEPEEWEVVILESLKTDRINHPKDPRKNREALWPDHLTAEELEKLRKKDEVIFDSLHQQNPTPKEGLLLPAGDLKRYSKDMLNGTPDGIVSVCDIADEGEDSLCHPVGYLYGDDIYIVDVIFTKEPIEVTQPMVAAMIDRYNVDRSRFESNNGGKGYAQKVKELKTGRTNITWKHTIANKHTRIIMKSGDVKERFYFLADEEQDEDYRKYFYELTHYPKNGKVKNDDAADGTTMLAEFVIGASGLSILK